jgi:gliding motility-associated-like protein
MGFKTICSILSLFLLTPFFGSAQNNNPQSNWSLKDPFEQKVFIENNEGQFDGKIGQADNKIYFKTQVTGIELYFTNKGLTYKYEKAPKLTEEQKEDLEKNRDSKDLPQPQDYFLSAIWKGSKPDVKIIPEDKVSFYYTYPVSTKHTIIAHAFKKLLYQNIYNNIDIEYSFPLEKKGIEYAIIVHPGADLSQVKLVYNNALSITNSSGDIKIESELGGFIEHAPGKVYYAENDEQTTSSFILNNNEIGFNAREYDKTKTLVIDPWTTNPAIIPYDAGYSIHSDLQGNVYIYGGGSAYPNANFQLIKLDGSGNIKWVYTPGFNTSFGDLAVDKQSGSVYLAGVFDGIAKINPSGVKTKSLAVNGPSTELWRLCFDNCSRQLIVGTGGNGYIGQGAVVDTNFSSFNSINYLGAVTTNHDVCLLTVDEKNGYCYMAVAQALWDNYFDNTLVKCPIPGLTPLSFSVSDGFSFEELYSVAYVGGNSEGANGFNGMAVGPNWLYLYDGATLERFDKSYGSLAKTSFVGGPSFAWAGLDADDCDNVYVGHNSTILEYDSAFNQVGSIAAPSTIYDLRLGHNNCLYVCGNGFVASYSVAVPPVSISIAGSPACSGCNGLAFVTLNNCNVNGATYNWSDGQTSQVATGLCGGTYKVTVMVDCLEYKDSIAIVASSNPSVEIPTSKINQVNCIGDDNGSATAIATGGTPPFNYTWLPTGATGETVDNLGQGTYTVVVQDANGCSAISSVDLNAADYELFIPNAFSPNGDGENDLLFVRSNCIKTMHLLIFDRWGNKVFETENQNTPWDGRYNGVPLNAGTYVYYVTGTLYGNKAFEKKGNVTLVR